MFKKVIFLLLKNSFVMILLSGNFLLGSPFSDKIKNMLINEKGEYVLNYLNEHSFSEISGVSIEEYSYYKGITYFISYRQTDKQNSQYLKESITEFNKAIKYEGKGDIKVRAYLYLAALYLLELQQDDLADKCLIKAEKLIETKKEYYYTICYWRIKINKAPEEKIQKYRTDLLNAPSNARLLDFRSTKFNNANILTSDIK